MDKIPVCIIASSTFSRSIWLGALMPEIKRCLPVSTISSQVRFIKEGGVADINAISPAIFEGVMEEMQLLFIQINPDLGFNSPEIVFSSTDLPLPFFPNRGIREGDGISRLASEMRSGLSLKPSEIFSNFNIIMNAKI